MSGSLNDPNNNGIVRLPRFQVLIAGDAIPGAISAEIVSNNHYHPDTFHAEFALYSDADYGAQYWGDLEPPQLVEIDLGFDPGDGSGIQWTPMFNGQIDHIQVHPQHGIVQIEGRDMSSVLIDAKTQEAYPNQTASQIVQIISARHNFAANVDTTNELVGQFYTTDHDVIRLGQFTRPTTEWDLLVFLAERSGFDLWVSTGPTINFKMAVTDDPTPWVVVCPGPDDSDSTDGTAVLQQSNAIDLRLERSLTLAKDIEVQVKSWNSRQASGFTKYAGANGPKTAAASPTSTTIQRYVFVRPGLTQASAQALAVTLAQQISQHERVITWREPGDLDLTARNMVNLTGTYAGSWSQSYYIDTITRRINMRDGFVMEVRAKNVSPQSQSSLG